MSALNVPRETSLGECDHEWERGRYLVNGHPIQCCTKCPRWKPSVWSLAFHGDPERRRRTTEETSRYLGEHRDV